MLLNNTRSITWEGFLDSDHIQALGCIENELGDNYTPAKENILRFMNIDLQNIKICILGQDPYFSEVNGNLVANGRAFQPNDLLRWDQSFKQVSLKNIIRLIHKTYNSIEIYEDIKKYKEIVVEINNGTFPLKQPREWFDSLETQGVLFLNRYLTTEIGTANAHRKIWDRFMVDVIRYIDQERPDMIWFLLGNEAIQCCNILKDGIIYKSRHPMMCSKIYEDDFLKADCFKKTMNQVNWLG